MSTFALKPSFTILDSKVKQIIEDIIGLVKRIDSDYYVKSEVDSAQSDIIHKSELQFVKKASFEQNVDHSLSELQRIQMQFPKIDQLLQEYEKL